eukprot:TRINITY_DN38518_c0_g1_i1.p1 TRINITY_DN38518_c0_g1~~TRINITY_DN38518_c0_g1_i1.p1  ORF type:complete len:393 (-),score=94.66 TRINITY_DN38518_c0_g1_i1:183-1361(-)
MSRRRRAFGSAALPLGVAWFVGAPVRLATGQVSACGPLETQGEVQGAPGFVCASKCDPATYLCSSGTYGAQCMLRDVDSSAYCAVVCGVDSQCSNGAQCKRLKQMEVGICVHPATSADWARTPSRKFAVGWPQRSPGSALPAFEVARTYNALQNLKSRYVIDDGDTDMVALKEFLSSVSAPGGGSAPAPSPGVLGGVLGRLGLGGTPPAAPTSPAPLSLGAPMFSAPVTLAPALGAAPAASSQGSWLGSMGLGDVAANKWSHDMRYFANNMMNGIPGIQKEISDTVWNVEHIDKRGVASEMLRSALMLFAGYLAVGCLIKSQMHGATGWDMVPHISFWSEYPNLVADGVTYLQILAGGMTSGKSSSSSSGNDLTGGIRSGSARGGLGAFDAL